MKPTQAQIEVATIERLADELIVTCAKIAKVEAAKFINPFSAGLIAEAITQKAKIEIAHRVAALTAAAEVEGDPCNLGYVRETTCGLCGAGPNDKCRGKALTAAAEVGEPEYLYDKQKRSLSKYDQVVAATIERCAQVADKYNESCRNGSLAAQSIAAAVRKLKDVP